jgi:hypothetical protein
VQSGSATAPYADRPERMHNDRRAGAEQRQLLLRNLPTITSVYINL